MNCYYHTSNPAVGLCKACGRGICNECATDIENGLACTGKCEARAKLINELTDWSEAVRNKGFSTTSKAFRDNALGMGAQGAIFAVIGAIGLRLHPAAFILIALGLIYIFWGLMSYRRSKAYTKLDSK